jgi:hypothetical protein
MTAFLAPGFSPNCRGPEVVQKPGWAVGLSPEGNFVSTQSRNVRFFALRVNSLCRRQGKRTMRETEVQIRNPA